jgi:hypothetical protein
VYPKVPSQMYLLINVQTDSDGRPTRGGDPQGVKEILGHSGLLRSIPRRPCDETFDHDHDFDC